MTAPGPNTLMPPSTQRAHFEPAWKGDRYAALDEVATRPAGPDGIRAIDCNFQWYWNTPGAPSLGGEAYALHYANPGSNGFTYYATPQGPVRRMTARELRKRDWTAGQVARWRRGPSLSSAAPRTYLGMVTYAVPRGVTITAELKSRFFTRTAVMRHMVAAARAAGHPPWFMALYGSLPFCRGKCAATVDAGGQFAVIFGRYQRLRAPFRVAVRSWRVKPTRVW